MSAVNEYLDKVLAECPEGAEELLVGELAKGLIKKYGAMERIEVHDRDGLVAYLSAAFIDIEDLPPEMREMAMVENDPNEEGIPAGEFLERMEEEYNKHCQELAKETGTNGRA